MLAQNSVDFPIFRGHAKQQRGRGFGALAQLLGELQSPLFKNI